MVSNNGGHTKHLDNTGVPVASTSKGSLFFAPKLREPRVRRDGLLLCARSVAVNVVLGRWIAVRGG